MIFPNASLVVEGMFLDQQHRRYSRLAAEKEAALPVNPTEDEWSDDAVEVDFSRVADAAIVAARLSIKNATKVLDSPSTQE